MSLIDEMMEEFVLMTKVKESDGEGGFNVSWSEGASFKGIATLDTSMRTRIAEAEGFTNTYTFTTAKNVELDFYEVVKRKRDGKIFRITSDGSDNSTPESASLDMRQYSAEKWRLS